MVRLIFSVLLAFSHPVWAEETEHTISVMGVGSVTSVPDIADVRLGVSTDARTARDALSKNSLSMKAVLDILKAEGILENDIQTQNLSLHPSFENRTPGKPPTVVGYTAQNTVAITVRELNNLGRVLDQVSEAGSNLIQSIQFGRNSTENLMNEARKLAVLDARSKAELYAKSAGIEVGKVISISEGAGHAPMPQVMARGGMETMAMDVPMAQGEVSLSASVHVVFLIE